jgi:prepilin-type N-terminal cleavage/methylation domain-containing protein
MQPTNNQQPKTQKAFTLIELLVVIAIVGILAGLAVVNMSGATTAAKIAKSKVFANSVNNSLLGNRISEWKFDEGTGTTTTDTVGTNSGALVNFNFNSVSGWRSGSSCVSGGCLQFDGTDDYVNVSDSSDRFNLSNNLTISAWVYPAFAGSSSGLEILSKYASASSPYISYGLEWYDTNKFSFSLGGIDNTFTTLYSATQTINNWYYVTGTYDGANATIYINGVLSNSAPFIKSLKYVNGQPLTIGTWYGGGTNYFNGSIDEVRIYNAALTASAIREQYLAGLDKLLANNQITKKDYQQRLADLNSIYATKE